MENCLDGLTFVITGILESIKREDTADLIQGYGGKVTHSVSKKNSFIVMGQDPGESKLSKVHCDVQLKRGKKNCEHKHSSCTFFPKFLKQIWVQLTVKTPGKLATNLQNEHNSLICKSIEETNMN